MPRIFISYRRDDSQEITGRIYDRLVSDFPSADIFRDIDNIPAGVDFREVLDEAVGKCDAAVVIIGPKWLSAADAEGKRRLDSDHDYVRIEVESALRRGVRVIPLLVSRAGMPKESELPAAIGSLAYRNARQVRPDPDFHRDMDLLVSDLTAIEAAGRGTSTGKSGASTPRPGGPAKASATAAPRAREAAATADAKPPRPRWHYGAAFAAAVALLAVAVTLLLPRTTTEEIPPEPPPPPAEHVNILALVNTERDSVSGKWELTGRGLTVETGRAAGPGPRRFMLRLPWDPPEEYCLRVRIRRIKEEGGAAWIGLASGEQRFAIMVDGQRDTERPMSGLVQVDGNPFFVPAPDNRKKVLPIRTVVTLACTVRRTGVTLTADDRTVFDWQGSPSRLGRGMFSPEPPLFLAGAGDATFFFQQIDLEPLGPDAGKPLTKK